jgi:hypothetical protein
MVHYRIHKRQPPVTILNQISPVHAPILYLEAAFQCDSVRLGLPSGLFPSGLPLQNQICIAWFYRFIYCEYYNSAKLWGSLYFACTSCVFCPSRLHFRSICFRHSPSCVLRCWWQTNFTSYDVDVFGWAIGIWLLISRTLLKVCSISRT